MVSEFAMMNCGKRVKLFKKLESLEDSKWSYLAKDPVQISKLSKLELNLDVDDKQQYSSARKVQSQRKLIKLEQNWKRLFKWIQRSSSDLWHWIQKMENESPMRLGFRKRIHFSAAADIVVSSQFQLPRWQVQSRGSWRRSSSEGGTRTYFLP